MAQTATRASTVERITFAKAANLSVAYAIDWLLWPVVYKPYVSAIDDDGGEEIEGEQHPD